MRRAPGIDQGDAVAGSAEVLGGPAAEDAGADDRDMSG